MSIASLSSPYTAPRAPEGDESIESSLPGVLTIIGIESAVCARPLIGRRGVEGRGNMPVVLVEIVNCGTSGRGDVGGGGAGAGTLACLRRRRDVLLQRRNHNR